MKNYTQLLKENSLKSTFQRINILDIIDKQGHSSVDEIYEKIIKLHPSISLATIYKNILLMVEKSVVVEVPIAGKKSKYELAKEDHIHLVCTECGLVEDKPCLANSSELFNKLSTNDNFKLKRREVNLYGVCKKCL
jgi:Fur family ferric uptake transcriptional regulator/Fur family peroxide stress response transcriptional regulator